jgi:hypothetical protein
MTVVELQQVMQRRVNRDLGKIFPNRHRAVALILVINFRTSSIYPTTHSGLFKLGAVSTWSDIQISYAPTRPI